MESGTETAQQLGPAEDGPAVDGDDSLLRDIDPLDLVI